MALPSTRWPSYRVWRAALGRHVLSLALVFLAPAFLFTGWLVSEYAATRTTLAVGWYQQGMLDLRAGHTERAIEDYRTALSYARENATYRLQLARVLVQSGRLDAASADLHRLWEDEPANSILNLELARLAVRKHELPDAVRYYNNAIYGAWPRDADAHRRETQLEFIDYLLANGRRVEAQAGLIALAADAPRDAGLRVALGDRLVRAGSEREALRQFVEAQAVDPELPAALSGAGRVALRLGQFADAQRYLRRARDAGDRSPETQRLLQIVTSALALDPSARGLSAGERVQRVRESFEVAMRAFENCVPALPQRNDVLATAASLHRRLVDVAPLLRGPRSRDAQVQQDTMDVVFDTVEFASAHCGSREGPDAGLLALAQARSEQR